MVRFFVDELPPAGADYALEGENLHHAQVLRLREGESLTLCDGRGMEAAGKVSRIDSGNVFIIPEQAVPSSSEPAVTVRVYVGLPKSDKLEHIIQKATELGAAEIIAFPSAFCVVKYQAGAVEKKLQRWQKIAESAAKQSGRGMIPKVRMVPSFTDAVKEAASADAPLFFYENERSRTLTQALAQPFETATIVTGPEGGFSQEEVAQAEQAGFRVCTLGTRILRCETAPLCALSAVMYAAGEY